MQNDTPIIQKKLQIGGIPAILWGKNADKVYIHVHGKMSRKEYAEDFARIAQEKGYQTISFDLPQHGEQEHENARCDIWNGIHDLKMISDYTFTNWKDVSLFACSLGAFFSLHSYSGLNFKKCLFQSPIVDMEHLIGQMMLWFDITPQQLFDEKEIETPIDTMTWNYFDYVKSHPVTQWSIPTRILYAANDNMQPMDVMQKFAERHSCLLTVSENSEHPFMAQEDQAVVLQWLNENI